MISGELYGFLAARGYSTSEIMLWPLPVDHPSFPAITFQQDNEDRSQTYEGPSGFVSASVALDVWGKGAEQVQTLAKAVRDDLNGYSGLIGSARCYLLSVDRMIDLYETDTELFRVSINLTIRHKEI
jgi:hypothetical protein